MDDIIRSDIIRSTASPRTVVEACYAAFARGDMQGVLARLAPDVVWVETVVPPEGGVFVGRAAVQASVLDRLMKKWDGFAMEVEELDEVGPYVSVTGTLRGVYRATGKALVAPFCHIWQVEGGRVVHLRHQNTPDLLRGVR